MQYMGPNFGSEDVIWTEVKPRAISHPRTQNKVPYTLNIYLPVCYIIYIFLTCDAVSAYRSGHKKFPFRLNVS